MPARAPPPFLDQPLDQHSTEKPEWHRHRGSGNERVGRVSTEEAAHTPRWQQTNRDKHYTRKGKAKHPVAIVIHHLGLSSRPERVVSNCNHHRHCRQNPCRHNQTQSYRVAYSAGVHETPENSPQHQRESARAHPNPHGAISEGNSEQFQKSAQRVIPSPTFPWFVLRVGVNKMACSRSCSSAVSSTSATIRQARAFGSASRRGPGKVIAVHPNTDGAPKPYRKPSTCATRRRRGPVECSVMVRVRRPAPRSRVPAPALTSLSNLQPSAPNQRPHQRGPRRTTA